MLKVKTKYDYREELCEALRSGKYKQGYGLLQYKDTYCVLGVFAKAVLNVAISPDGKTCTIMRSLNYKPLLELLGEEKGEIIMMNDDRQSFEAIAYYLENLP